MAQPSDFILPREEPAPPARTAQPPAPPPDLGPGEGVSNKELIIGAGIALLAALLFWFLSRWFSEYLVRRRKSPTAANRAGWSLFLLLTITVVLAVYGVLGQAWAAWWFIGAIGFFMTLTLVIFLVAALGA